MIYWNWEKETIDFELSSLAEGEHAIREYKVDIPEEREKYLKTAVAFANSIGGQIVFGVQDKTWEVVGFSDEEVQSKRDAVVNSIYDACEPTIAARVKTLRVGERSVFIVDIEPGVNKPYFIRKQGLLDGTYVRIGSETRHASFETVQELILEGSNRSYDQLVRDDVSISDVEMDALCARLTEHAALRGEADPPRLLTVTQLLGWGLVSRDPGGSFHPTNGLLLLLGQLEVAPFGVIQCAVFKGVDRNVFITRKEIRGPIDQQVEDATDFVLEHIDMGSRIEGPQRRDYYELPVGSVREMIANAVAHRSYVRPGCAQVALFDDRLEVTSPGRLAAELSVEELREGHSRIRNKGIAEVFAYLRLIEKGGAGIPRVYRESKEYGLKEPRITGGSASFRIEMFRRPFDVDAFGVIDPRLRQPERSVATNEDDRDPDTSGRLRARRTAKKGTQSVHRSESAGAKDNTLAASPRKMSRAQEALLGELRHASPREGSAVRSLSHALGWTDSKTRYYLGKLRNLGAVEHRGARKNGAWFLTESASNDTLRL